MATVPETTLYQTFAAPHTTPDTFPPFGSLVPTPRRRIVRRRPTPEQGRALEILGHAIEYLIDSELRYSDAVPSKPIGDATRVLMALSREVFSECAELVPLGQRIQSCLINMFGRPTFEVQVGPGRQR